MIGELRLLICDLRRGDLRRVRMGTHAGREVSTGWVEQAFRPVFRGEKMRALLNAALVMSYGSYGLSSRARARDLQFLRAPA